MIPFLRCSYFEKPSETPISGLRPSFDLLQTKKWSPFNINAHISLDLYYSTFIWVCKYNICICCWFFLQICCVRRVDRRNFVWYYLRTAERGDDNRCRNAAIAMKTHIQTAAHIITAETIDTDTTICREREFSAVSSLLGTEIRSRRNAATPAM